MTQLLSILAIAVLMSAQTDVTMAQNSLGNAVPKELSDCLSDGSGKPETGTCFGRVMDKCSARFPNEVTIPFVCWEEELSAWNHLLRSNYQSLLSEVGSGNYAEFERPIRASQHNWIEQKNLDCKLEVASTPRTYASTWPACLARATMHRAFFLQSLLGADWSPFPE